MPDKTGEENSPRFVNRVESAAEDREWIIAAVEGDKKAYGRLVTKYQKRLFRFIFMMLGRKDATEDIVQEAFVKAYLALGTFETEKPLYPWLATIARNLALNVLKKEEREKPASEMEEYLHTVPNGKDNPADSFLAGQNSRALADAVRQLPPKFREVFVLRMIEKMSYDEIARKLDISPGTVDSRLYRARQKLMELLKDYL